MALGLWMQGLGALAQNPTANAETILGKWTNDDKTRTIEFVKKNNTYEAIVREADKAELVGKTLITSLVAENGKYNGKIYMPRQGKSFSCTIVLKDEDTMMLTGKAGLMSRTKTWTRVK